MKKWFLLCLCACAIGATTNRIYITWDNQPEYDTNASFFIYSKTNLADPVWLPVTNIGWANWTNATKVEIPAATDNARYFVVTASNLFGESDFSEPALSRRLPRANKPRIGAF